MAEKPPSDAPPSYADATGPSSSSFGKSDHAHLQIPGASSSSSGKNAIPSSHRRSMEDEQRPLPPGWARAYDAQSEHQFFVDTTKEPHRSIWTHPYDDDQYLASLSTEERERIEHESLHRGRQPSHADIIAAHSDDEDGGHSPTTPKASSGDIPTELPPRDPKGKGSAHGNRSFGRKFKDKLTGTTHEQRAADRERRAEEEQRLYRQHVRVRQAMAEATRTGRPVLVAQDRDGKDVYVEPPAPDPYGGSGGYGPYGAGGYGYNPYGSSGVYTTPNARYIRPQMPYGRPYGGGFGGGYGLPLALGGGLLGGLLLGDVISGGF